MPADILTVADAVVTALNAGSFSIEFEAERSYFATRELSADEGLSVTVMPAADEGKLNSRTSSVHDFTIHIAVQQKLAATTSAEIDPLLLLTQEIADYFLYGSRPGNAKLVSPQIRVLFNEAHLRELKQFTAVIQLTLKHWRDAG